MILSLLFIFQHPITEATEKLEEYNIEYLKGGSSAKILKITLEGKNYVWRSLPEKSKEDIRMEFTGMKLASDYGFGPKVLAFDINEKFVIMEFIDGKDFRKELNIDQELIEIVTLLKKIHTSPKVNFKVHPMRVKNIEGYFEKSKGKVSKDDLVKIENIIKTVKNFNYEFKTNIHGDFHSGNIIFNKEQGFIAIDFEDFGVGDPFYDLANIATEHYWWNVEVQQKLLRLYLGKEPSQDEWQHFNEMRKSSLLCSALHKTAEVLHKVPAGESITSITPDEKKELFDKMAPWDWVDQERYYLLRTKYAFHHLLSE